MFSIFCIVLHIWGLMFGSFPDPFLPTRLAHVTEGRYSAKRLFPQISPSTWLCSHRVPLLTKREFVVDLRLICYFQKTYCSNHTHFTWQVVTSSRATFNPRTVFYCVSFPVSSGIWCTAIFYIRSAQGLTPSWTGSNAQKWATNGCVPGSERSITTNSP
jgi:hypothetical protein